VTHEFMLHLHVNFILSEEKTESITRVQYNKHLQEQQNGQEIRNFTHPAANPRNTIKTKTNLHYVPSKIHQDSEGNLRL
jgi:hypothetical protein